MTKPVKTPEHKPSECTAMLLPVRDALDILSGKWKIPIIISLTFGNKPLLTLSQ